MTSHTQTLWHTLSPLSQRRTMPRNKVVPHPCNQFNTRRKESNLLLFILPQPATVVAVFIWLLPLHTKRRCAGTAKPKATWTRFAVLRLTLLQRVTLQPLAPHWIRSLLPVFTYWTMGRLENDVTPNQACSNLVPPPPNSTVDSLRQIVILQLHRHEAR